LNDFRSRGLWANAPTGSSVPLAVNALERTAAELPAAGVGMVDNALGSAGGRLAKGAADLPMDLASRMARAKEMGFDTDNVLLHASRASEPFDAFDAGRVGSNSGNQGFYGRGFYATPDEGYAEDMLYGGGGHIRELFARTDKPFDIDYANFDDATRRAAEIYPDAPLTEGGFMDPKNIDGWTEALKRNGYDAVRVKALEGDLDSHGSEFLSLYPNRFRDINAAFDPAMSDSANLLAANAKTGAAVPLATNALERQPQGIRAYHGSPHDFDRFSLDKIGTGEGAQAYGHGLYFADNEDVARSYRDAGVKTFTDQESYDAYKKAMLAWDGKGDSPKAPGQDGRMYEVNIKANPEDFLDWDKPLSQQSEAVRNALSVDDPAIVGRDAYDMLAKRLTQDPNWEPSPDRYGGGYGQARQDITQQLREAGIPGIRYLDGMSRERGAGTSNYVVFSDDIVEILRKYSNPPTGAIVPAGMEASQGDDLNTDPAILEYLRLMSARQ